MAFTRPQLTAEQLTTLGTMHPLAATILQRAPAAAPVAAPASFAATDMRTAVASAFPSSIMTAAAFPDAPRTLQQIMFGERKTDTR